jgi:protein gp37
VSGLSTIEWTDATWNPVTGCDRVSPGCAHCYALTLAKRLKAMGNPKYQRDGDPKTSGPGFGVTLHPDVLEQPLRWRRPRMVFVNSMSDLFHEEIPDEFIARVFNVMAGATQHTFQVLTKRPERAAQFVPAFYERVYREATYTPLENVWLGVSIENARWVGRADVLREIPAAVRFVSAEPLLGPLVERAICSSCSQWPYADSAECQCEGTRWWWTSESLYLGGIDWLIAGGESGRGARPVDPGWVRDLRDYCVAADVAFFFKQWGGRTPKAGGRELDGRTWDEMPAGAEQVAA